MEVSGQFQALITLQPDEGDHSTGGSMDPKRRSGHRDDSDFGSNLTSVIQPVAVLTEIRRLLTTVVQDCSVNKSLKCNI
jgi:hypothetical protein